MSQELTGLEYLKEKEIKNMKCDMNKPFAFISYSHNDSQIVLNVFNKLMIKGHNLWIDVANMPFDEREWTQSAMDALQDENCKKAFFFRSESSMVKETIKDELALIKIIDHIKSIVTVDIWHEEGMNAEKYLAKVINRKIDGYSKEKAQICNKICKYVSVECKAIRLAGDAGNDILRLVEEMEEALEDIEDFSNNDKSDNGDGGIKEDGINYDNAGSEAETDETSGGTIDDEQGKDGTGNGSSDIAEKSEVGIQSDSGDKQGSKTVKKGDSVPEPDQGTKNGYESPVGLDVNADTTLEEFEKMCEDVAFCQKLREAREKSNKGSFDYLIASFLGGCDAPVGTDENIKRKAAYNYCTYVISKTLDLENVKIGSSSFTWKSMCHQRLRDEERPKERKLGSEINSIFEALDRKTTIGKVLEKYQKEEKGFSTKDNAKIFEAWKYIKETDFHLQKV